MVTSMETSNFGLAALCYILTPRSLCGIFGRLLVLKILVITGCCFPQSYKVKPSETWPIGPTVFCRTRQSQVGCYLAIALQSYLYSSEQGSSLSQVRELEKFRRRGRSEKWAESYILYSSSPCPNSAQSSLKSDVLETDHNRNNIC